MADEKRIALLIDAENISAQYADYIMGEVDNYGICSYKRIYGSWDRIVKTKWESEIRKNSLKAMMQRSEEHTSELQSLCNLVCRLLLEKKKHA